MVEESDPAHQSCTGAVIEQRDVSMPVDSISTSCVGTNYEQPDAPSKKRQRIDDLATEPNKRAKTNDEFFDHYNHQSQTPKNEAHLDWLTTETVHGSNLPSEGGEDQGEKTAS